MESTSEKSIFTPQFEKVLIEGSRCIDKQIRIQQLFTAGIITTKEINKRMK